MKHSCLGRNVKNFPVFFTKHPGSPMLLACLLIVSFVYFRVGLCAIKKKIKSQNKQLQNPYLRHGICKIVKIVVVEKSLANDNGYHNGEKKCHSVLFAL